MGWNRRDDGANDHPKIRALGSWEPDLLWQKAGIGCSKSKTGGLVEPADLELYGFLAYLRTPAKLRKAVAKLVEVGLWHDSKTITGCDRCTRTLEALGLTELPAGAYLFHDWGDCNPSKQAEADDVTRFKEKRARQLKDMTTRRAEVLARDGEWCRYCACRTTSKSNDQRSSSRRVLDHVDPMGDNSLGNLATACGRCNGRKRDRTPAEADMPLLAPPRDGQPPRPYPDGYEPFNASDPGPDPLPAPLALPLPAAPETETETSRNEDANEDANEPNRDPDRDPPSCVTRDGSDRVGTAVGPDPRPDPGSVGSGRAGPGTGLVGLGRVVAGSGLAGLVSGGAGAGAPPGAPSSTTTDVSDGFTVAATDVAEGVGR